MPLYRLVLITAGVGSGVVAIDSAIWLWLLFGVDLAIWLQLLSGVESAIWLRGRSTRFCSGIGFPHQILTLH